MTFIDEHSGRFAVALLLRVLQIAESTYYAWKNQAGQPCDRDRAVLGLLSNIYEIWETSGHSYGADRVHRQLRRDGIRVGSKRVERLMADQGWQAAFLRRGWRGGSTVQTRKPRRHQVWSTATSPRPPRTGSGSPTPPGRLRLRRRRSRVKTPTRQPADGKPLAIANRAVNRLLRGLRWQGEHGFAILVGRWKTFAPQHHQPRKIGDLVAAALHVIHFEYRYLNQPC